MSVLINDCENVISTGITPLPVSYTHLHDTVVRGVHQTTFTGDLDGLSDEGFADVVAKAQHRDPSLLINDPAKRLRREYLALFGRCLLYTSRCV